MEDHHGLRHLQDPSGLQSEENDSEHPLVLEAQVSSQHHVEPVLKGFGQKTVREQGEG